MRYAKLFVQIHRRRQYILDHSNGFMPNLLVQFFVVYVFILVDSYSIEICRRIFSSFGLPGVFLSDHVGQFTSAEFEQFSRMNGIVHKMGAPYQRPSRTVCSNYQREIEVVELQPLMVLNREIRSRLDKIIQHANGRVTLRPKGHLQSMTVFLFGTIFPET